MHKIDGSENHEEVCDGSHDGEEEAAEGVVDKGDRVTQTEKLKSVVGNTLH